MISGFALAHCHLETDLSLPHLLNQREPYILCGVLFCGLYHFVSNHILYTQEPHGLDNRRRKQALRSSAIGCMDVTCNVSLALIFQSSTILIPDSAANLLYGYID